MKIISQRYIGDGQFMLQLGGLSSETKPTDAFVATGSQFFEDDTDAVFTFSGLTWNLEKNGQMKDLPVVTSTDNGKVLKVANGVWSVGEDGGGEGGGGAEKFVVTLTQDAQTEEWTADKTVAEIVAAYEANQVVVAQYVAEGFTCELPINAGISVQGVEVAIFIGFENAGEDNKNVTVVCANEGSGEDIQVTKNLIPTSSTAPLIVTLSAGATEGQFVGNKTYQEAYEAFIAGRNVVFYASNVNGVAETVTAAENNTGAANPYALSTKSFASSGGASDYITVNAG